MSVKTDIYMCPPSGGVHIAPGVYPHLTVKIPYRGFQISICFDRLVQISDDELQQRNHIRIYDLRETPDVDATEMLMGIHASAFQVAANGQAIGEIMRRIDLVLMLESQEGFPKVKHIHNLDKKYLQILVEKKPF